MEKYWQVIKNGLKMGEHFSLNFSPLPSTLTPNPHHPPSTSSCRLDVQFSWRMMKLAKQMGWGRRNKDWEGRGGGLGWGGRGEVRKSFYVAHQIFNDQTCSEDCSPVSTRGGRATSLPPPLSLPFPRPFPQRHLARAVR